MFGDGVRWSYAETLNQTRRAASRLADLGVSQGDHVLLALPNGRDMLSSWFGINDLGAAAVPINLAYKGTILERVIDNSDAALLVTTSAWVSRLKGLALARLACVLLVDDEPCEQVAGLAIRRLSDFPVHEHTPPPVALARPILPFDLQCILYTSGTTGPSKGVMCSYLHLHTAGRAVYFMTEDDRYLVNLPMYHVSGVLPCMLMMALGASVAIVERFRTEEFWDTVAATESSFVILLGVMIRYILSASPHPKERAGTLKKIIAQPLDADALRLRERFGFDVYTSFNMTEISLPIVSGPNPEVVGTCGTVREGCECRLVDEWDCEVPTGEVGELIIRCDQPWAMNHGYYKNADATARAWRNGWFHTGDAFRRNVDGFYFFVDRMKDTIRRRGENISSFEVEAEVMAHESVREAAAVAVPSDISEDEVLVCVSLQPGRDLAPADLIAHLAERLPYFMVPRYLRIMEDLPKTPTQKLEKHVLRAAGITPDTWDRERAGIRIVRDMAGSSRRSPVA